MSKLILVINARPEHLTHRLSTSFVEVYAEGASAAGHQIRARKAGGSAN